MSEFKKEFKKPSLTRQSHADESDINRILGKWRQTGFINNVNLHRPAYEDFSNTEGYMEAMNAIKKAEEVFAALPSRVRARVGNDPAALVDFVNDPANDEELRELGLKNPVEEKPPIPAQPLAAAAEGAEEGKVPITNVEGP